MNMVMDTENTLEGTVLVMLNSRGLWIVYTVGTGKVLFGRDSRVSRSNAYNERRWDVMVMVVMSLKAIIFEGCKKAYILWSKCEGQAAWSMHRSSRWLGKRTAQGT